MAISYSRNSTPAVEPPENPALAVIKLILVRVDALFHTPEKVPFSLAELVVGHWAVPVRDGNPPVRIPTIVMVPLPYMFAVALVCGTNPT
jgi:hypothetical protein